MKKNTITYETLFKKLRDLGFSEKTVQVNGHSKRYFQRGADKVSGLYLPDWPTEEAASMHILAVKTILKRCGLFDEYSWLRT